MDMAWNKNARGMTEPIGMLFSMREKKKKKREGKLDNTQPCHPQLVHGHLRVRSTAHAKSPVTTADNHDVDGDLWYWEQRHA